MSKKETPPFTFQYIYPNMRYLMGMGRKIYEFYVNLRTRFSKRPLSSTVLPDAYTVSNTSTIDSEFGLTSLSGEMPTDIEGSLYIAQCLGAPKAFMIGDTNIVRLDFGDGQTKLTNRLIWTPAALARLKLEKTRHRFDFFGLMYLSPGMGMFSYTEGMYLMPDGRIAVTSDVDRPWLIERDSLRVTTPVGRRDEWLPMMADSAGEVMGNLFAGYSNSHVIYTDHETNEVFLANYQYKQANGEHPVKLVRWNGESDFESWLVLGKDGEEIEIKQSIHELIFTRDYILLADTAFVAGTEMLVPWVSAPLPSDKTVVYIIDRRELKTDSTTVSAREIVVDESCIHLIAEYDNPDDKITVYMLHTPATNTAELLRDNDRDLDGNFFPERLTGYGTLPVLDLSSVGKHLLDVKKEEVSQSLYIAEMPYTWGPYLYAYMGRQTEPYNGQDLFVMFKGFSKDILPQRIFDAYKDVDNRRVPIEEMVSGKGLNHNNSICRITTDEFAIADSYIFPDRVLLYTIACLDSSKADHAGYVIAGVVTDDAAGDESSGHEYWLFAADDLASGPVTKLGHPSLNNTTLFHTVYIPKTKADAWQKPEKAYQVQIKDDYPKEELKKWDPALLSAFDEVIWPYFDQSDPEATAKAEKIAAQLSTRRVPSHVGSEDIIGEERITDGADFAERMITESERMWKTTGWKVERYKNGVLVESKPVSGAFESSGVLVTRSTGEINAPAQETFDMLVSPTGYAVIDPISKPEDHELPPLEVYEWREGSRLEAAIATTNLPMMPPTKFVVLNAIDPAERIFVSKSIIHDGCPGGSKYSNEKAPDDGERALNTFAIKVEPISENRCRVLCINYADMAGKTGASMNNFINTKYFLPPLYKRIAKAMNAK
ncbi:MAG: hypothetical protein GY755_11000 [Chloroflexi bacterium]|nr:hypothetical protein [Chloroflexota bacterium]